MSDQTRSPQSVVVPIDEEGLRDAVAWLERAFPKDAVGFSTSYRPTMTAVQTVLSGLAAAPAPSSLAGGEVRARLENDLRTRNLYREEDGQTRLKVREDDLRSILAALTPRHEAPAREGVEWSDIATAPEGVEVWGFRPAPDGMPALYGVIDLVQFEEDAWFDANGDQVTAPTLWAPTNKPPHPITGKPALTPPPRPLGWGVDMFIDAECERCGKAFARLSTPDALKGDAK